MGTPFKHALVDHPETAWRVGHQAGVSDVRISKLASGQAVPTQEEKEILADILNRDSDEIFPEPLPAA